jgi:hypothetical protein
VGQAFQPVIGVYGFRVSTNVIPNEVRNPSDLRIPIIAAHSSAVCPAPNSFCSKKRRRLDMRAALGFLAPQTPFGMTSWWPQMYKLGAFCGPSPQAQDQVSSLSFLIFGRIFRNE